MGRDEVEPIMVAAYEGGVNFFDSAERYGDGSCETIIGEIIQRQKWPRESLILGTKVSPRGTEAAKGCQIGLSRKRLIDALEVCLKRYRTDCLDLYFLHRPDPQGSFIWLAVGRNPKRNSGFSRRRSRGRLKPPVRWRGTPPHDRRSPTCPA